MILPFELYCRRCGCRLIGVAEELALSHGETSTEAVISENVRGRTIKCANCGRVVTTDVMVRADVIFSEWGENGNEKAKAATFYV